VSNKKKPLVLVVDDDESIRALLYRLMERDGYAVLTADDGQAGIEVATELLPEVILIDGLMPRMDGFQAVAALKRSERTANIPIIMITSLVDQESRLRALQAGANEFISKPIDRNEVSLRVRNMLMLREYTALLADRNRILEGVVEERSRQVFASHRETIERLARAASFKDEVTGAHVRRISHYTAELASALGMPAEFCETIRYASQMHDIGKIAIPEAILLKAGPLTDQEWEVMKTHTTAGARLLAGGESPYLRMGAEIALSHHELWDGSGYPASLKGPAIPISARIMNLCDQYDALRSERPYKPPLSHDRTVEVITKGDGRTSPGHFDPEILSLFQRLSPRFAEIFATLQSG
jgi:putative two-component system response regulator